MGKLAKELRRILEDAGFELARQGKGDHQIWRNPQSGVSVVVDDGMQSRHTANGVLKQAGLPKAF